MNQLLRTPTAMSLGLALVSVVACSGGAGSTTFNQGGGSAPETGTEFVAAFCELYMPCCSAASLPSDGARCRALLDEASQKGAYDRAAAQRCLDGVKRMQSSGELCAGDSGDDMCDGVFAAPDSGSKAPGEACEEDAQCAKSAEGDTQCAYSGSGKRICQVQLRGTDGAAPCLGTKDGNVTTYRSTGDEPPSRGFICDTEDQLFCESESGKCAKLAPAGAACEGGDGCQSGLYCDFMERKCAPRKAAGSECQTAFECQKTADCKGSPRKCVDRAPDGAPCKTGLECASQTCANDKCGGSGASSLGIALLCGGGSVKVSATPPTPALHGLSRARLAR